MRKVNVTIAIISILFIFNTVAKATGVKNEFKDFEITLVNDLNMGKKVEAVWTLNYNESENPVTVVKRKTIEGIEYVVSSEFFTVRYLASANGFGAKEARKSWSAVHSKINHAVINQKQLQNQGIITPNKVDDKMALGLIASYLPDLINDGYAHVLN
ncbi:hypothetical protein [uncultured Draconibacterium sp.]|uniref:hypothetical protein n=1 Tax=uncultured Draconibacterium sp. TaxID=1573823 RepID=UPI003260FAA7